MNLVCLLLLDMFFMSFGELRVDDGKCQIQQEEGTDEDQSHEVDPDVVVVSLLKLFLDITPSFKGCGLEYG